MKNNLQNSLVKQGERVDDLQNGFFVIQDPEKFCFGMDAVLLSGFAKIKKGEQVLDMGTGTGIIPILLKAKTPGQHFTGLKFRKSVPKWLPGASDITAWTLILILSVGILRRLLKFLEQLLSCSHM